MLDLLDNKVVLECLCFYIKEELRYFFNIGWKMIFFDVMFDNFIFFLVLDEVRVGFVKVFFERINEF